MVKKMIEQQETRKTLTAYSKEIAAKKVQRGFSVVEIADVLEEDKAVIEEIMKEL